MPPSDRDKGKEAVERVLDTFYRNIGTPAPAPGIERLAFFAVEAAYMALREQWEDELLSDKATEEAVRQAWPVEDERVVIEDLKARLDVAIRARLATMPHARLARPAGERS